MRRVLNFGYAETVSKIHTVSDAQILLDLVFYVGGYGIIFAAHAESTGDDPRQGLPSSIWSRRRAQGIAVGARNICKDTTRSTITLDERTRHSTRPGFRSDVVQSRHSSGR